MDLSVSLLKKEAFHFFLRDDIQEDELKRALERAEMAEGKLKDVENELEAVGENMKQLEISAEKAAEREDKLKTKIRQIMERLKEAEARYEYGEYVRRTDFQYFKNSKEGFVFIIQSWRTKLGSREINYCFLAFSQAR